jgi:hypothetical protein
MSGAHRYHSHYCEENVWWLCQHPEVADRRRWVTFVSNEDRRCLFRHQTVVAADEVVIWDYHVLLIVESEQVEAWDLDTRLGMPVPLAEYLDATFPSNLPKAIAPQPRLRLVEAPLLLPIFTTDRSHMRQPNGIWLKPPPPWHPPTAPGHPMNLPRLIDMNDDIAGEVLDLDALYRRAQQ